MLTLDARNKPVLFISDTHIPYSHIDYLKFLKRIKERIESFADDYLVVHIGDEVDNHAISFHDSDPDLLGAGAELEKSIEEIQEGLHELFPKLYLLESNHGSLVYRKQKKYGLPIACIKSLQEIYGTPQWEWHHEILLKTNKGDVYVCHGKSGSYGKLAREMGCSAVQGHYHTRMEITYHESVCQERFNMFIGCLADRESMAMAYAKNLSIRFQLGTGWIDEFGSPHLIKMPLDEQGRLK